jgi:hypothetical protein
MKWWERCSLNFALQTNLGEFYQKNTLSLTESLKTLFWPQKVENLSRKKFCLPFCMKCWTVGRNPHYFDPKNMKNFKSSENFTWSHWNKPLASQKTYMDIRISRFDFLWIAQLTQVGDFSLLVDFGASVDHYNVLKSGLLDLNILREFNVLSKSGLGIEIGHICAEI